MIVALRKTRIPPVIPFALNQLAVLRAENAGFSALGLGAVPVSRTNAANWPRMTGVRPRWKGLESETRLKVSSADWPAPFSAAP